MPTEVSRLGSSLVTLDAATATDLIGTASTGAEITGADTLSLLITNQNTGSDNPLTALSLYLSPDPTGTRFGAAETVPIPGGTLAKNAALLVVWPTRGARRLRVVGTSASGTHLAVDLHTQRIGSSPAAMVNNVPVYGSDPAVGCFSISASDSADLAHPTRGLLVGTAGNAKVTMLNGDTPTVPLVAGYNPLCVTRVWAAGLGASSIFGLY